MRQETALERQKVWAKKRRALELRLTKMSYRAIAEELEISVETAHTWVREQTAIQLPQDEMDDLRAHEVAAYDASEQRLLMCQSMMGEQAQRVIDNEGNPIDELARIESIERTLSDVRRQRALLLGLNRPIIVSHNVKVRSVLDEEIELLVSQLTGGGNVMSDPEMVDAGDDE